MYQRVSCLVWKKQFTKGYFDDSRQSFILGTVIVSVNSKPKLHYCRVLRRAVFI
jgi:hypothetical protein